MSAIPLELEEDKELLKEATQKYGGELDAVTLPLVTFEFAALKASALCGDITNYAGVWMHAWQVTCRLFSAVQPNARNKGAHPEFFWKHQPIGLLRGRFLTRQQWFSISKDRLLEAAALYLWLPKIRTNRLDWIFLDAFVLADLVAISEHLLYGTEGMGTQWAVRHAGCSESRYLWLKLQVRLADIAFYFVAWPAAAYYLFVNDHRVWGLAMAALWPLVQIFRFMLGLDRWRVRRTTTRMLQHLGNLYRMLGEKTISPRKLREELDSAAAAGVVFDSAVFTIVDRIVARDPTAFFPY